MPDTFNVIDLKLGREPTPGELEEIIKNEGWAKHLHACDIDAWFVTEFGDLGLMDDCGNLGYPPEGRFSVQWTSSKGVRT